MKSKFNLIFSILFVVFLQMSFAQSKPPVAGSYYCNTTTYEVGAGGINHATGEDIFGNNPIKIIPAFFGDIVIDGKGNYRLTQSKHTGKYNFDKANSALTFTGDLSLMKVSGYKSTGFFISYKGLAYECNCRGVKKEPDAVVKNPNNSFGGLLVASLAYNSVDYFDLTNSNTINTYSYFGNTKVEFKGKSLHLQEAYDNIRTRTDYPIVEIRDFKGNKLASYIGKGNNGREWQTGVYEYGVLSPDGSKLLLSGKLSEKFGTQDYNYRDFRKPAYAVINAGNGNEIKVFSGETTNKWPASWLPNGGIVLPNADGGIDITDADLSNRKTIYSQLVGFAKCSPDGKKILFQKGTQLFTINIDGGNETQFTNNEVDLSFTKTRISDVCWSPDGKAIAIMLPDDYFSNKYYALLVASDGKKATMVKDKMGNRITFIRPYINWINQDEPATPPIQQISNSNDGKAKSSEEINTAKKIKANAFTIYEPSPQHTDADFAKAWELYTKVMEADLDNFNDVAAAITYVVSLNYMHINNINSISTPTTEKVYNQITKTLLQDDNFKKLSNIEKQTMTEQIILDGLETALAASTKDPQKIKETALQLMKKYIGKNAEKMKITENGMEF
jgi:hypothetical protein